MNAYRSNTREEILNWLGEQWESERFSLQELGHIADCIKIIDEWYYKKEQLYDEFFVYLLKGNLFNAVHYADNTNQLALALYVKYFYNYLPGDYRSRINEQYP